MKKVSSFIYCSDITENLNTPKKSLAIINPISIINLNFVPTYYSFNTFFVITGIDKGDEIETKFINLDNNNIINTNTLKLDIPVDIPEKEVPKDLSTITISMNNYNIIIKEYGLYATKVYVNKIEIAEFPILIKKVENDEHNLL